MASVANDMDVSRDGLLVRYPGRRSRRRRDAPSASAVRPERHGSHADAPVRPRAATSRRRSRWRASVSSSTSGPTSSRMTGSTVPKNSCSRHASNRTMRASVCGLSVKISSEVSRGGRSDAAGRRAEEACVRRTPAVARRSSRKQRDAGSVRRRRRRRRGRGVAVPTGARSHRGGAAAASGSSRSRRRRRERSFDSSFVFIGHNLRDVSTRN
mmetsp:Transcript_10948/g.21667  ORF Transcript_10948/g.21667 Transcript_10948/m.21667 type:complete len:212 (+) Transcript_10948:2545-3180(+)